MPPARYFVRVLKSCPRAALLYIDLWKNVSILTGSLSIKKNEIRKEHLVSPTIYRNLLASLAYLNLISFIESDDKYQVEVMGLHVDE
jgi:hypothetical protein